MTNPYRKALGSRKSQKTDNIEPTEPIEQEVPETSAIEPNQAPPKQESAPQVEPVELIEPAQPKKRGRPPTGKRSREGWIGRTYYVKKETDLDVEEWLLKLKRRGVDIDKSELVEMLLAAWVKWQQGENIEIHLDNISPIQKSRNSNI